MVVAGWECNDLSSAGGCAGLEGVHSRTYYDMVRVVGTLQQMQLSKPPAYLIENIPLHLNHKSAFIREVAYPLVCQGIGTPVTIDAAQLGSYAHRLRSFWTNLAPCNQLQAALSAVQRPPGRLVEHIMGPGRHARDITRSDSAPLYIANIYKPGGDNRRVVFPTLMAYPVSYAFRAGGPGTVYDSRIGRFTQPDAEERERALGYPSGCTAAPGLSAQHRCALLGRAMDGYTLEMLLAVCMRLPEIGQTKGGEEAALSAQTTILFANPRLAAFSDIWDDATTLDYLKGSILPQSYAEQRRVLKRTLHYELNAAGEVVRTMPDLTTRVVPPPDERLALVKQSHEQCGHFGRKRTRNLLCNNYWWVGMSLDVDKVIDTCKICSRINISFNATHPTMMSIPIHGMFYRWGCDLCTLPTSDAGYSYILVCIEYFSKWVELIPLKSKEASETAAAFMSHVLGRYGAPAEVLTDQGTEFQGAFHALLTDCLIDHRMTSPGHPQADGLAERCVQTVKKGLRKMTDDLGTAKNWEAEVPWLALGYRCSTQRATKLSPYQLLFARLPVIPPAVHERLSGEIDFDDPAAASANLLQRVRALQQSMPAAMDNILIAQHRDTLRYGMVRSGGFSPKLRRFEVGDFVYTKRRNVSNTLQVSSHPEILRVLEVRPEGVLILQGKCGRTVPCNVINCAPCHLTNLDREIDRSLARPDLSLKCEVCRFTDGDSTMLLCDGCSTGWHMGCLIPPLTEIPRNEFKCPQCLAVPAESASAPPRRGTRARKPPPSRD